MLMERKNTFCLRTHDILSQRHWF